MMLIKKTFEVQKEEALKKSLVIDEPTKDKKSFEIDFPEELLFFHQRDRLVIEFTKYIMHTISIPLRVNNLFIKKKKLKDKIDLNVKTINDKYEITNLESDASNKELIEYLKKYKSDLKSQEGLKLIIADKTKPESSKNSILRNYVDNEKSILKEKKKMIIANSKVKEYFLDQKRIENDKKSLMELEKITEVLTEETEKFDKNLEEKKRKFFAVNTLFLEEISYITNEYNLSEYKNLLLPLQERKEYLKKIKDIYTFYYVLMNKVDIKQAKLAKLKDIANELFKKAYLFDMKLTSDITKARFQAEKIKLAIQKKELEEELFFYKYNFHNIKLCMTFNEDILFKCYHFLIFIDYSRILLNNISVTRGLNNKLLNQKGLIQIPKVEILYDGKNKLKLKFKELNKILERINKYYKNIVNSRKRLYQKKRELQIRYNNLISQTIEKSKKIEDAKIVPDRDLKNLQDSQILKQIKEDEELKIKLQSLLQDITDTNKLYVLLKKPEEVLLNSKIAKIKYISPIDKKTKKKLKKQSKLVFVDTILQKYSPEERKKLELRLEEINKKIGNLKKFNTHNLLYNFIPRITRKSLIK